MAINQDMLDTLEEYFGGNNVNANIVNITQNPSNFDYFMDARIVEANLAEPINANIVNITQNPSNFDYFMDARIVEANLAEPIEAKIVNVGSPDNFDYAMNAKIVDIDDPSNFAYQMSSEVDLTSVINAVNSLYDNSNTSKIDFVSLNALLNTIKSKVESIDLSVVESKIDNVSNSIDFSSIINKIDSIVVNEDENIPDLVKIDNAIKTIDVTPNVVIDNDSLDLTGIDLSKVNYSVDGSSLNLELLETNIVKYITDNLSQVLATTSLNGSYGSKFNDNDLVMVQGFTKIFTVESSFIVSTSTNKADYLCVVKDVDDKKMIVVQSMLVKVVVEDEDVNDDEEVS